MKILHCIDSIDPKYGGPVEAVRQFAQASDDHCQVEIVTLDSDVSRWTHSWKVPVHAVPGALTSYRYAPKLVDWLVANRPSYDAVIVHGIFRYNLIGAWQALRNSSTPYFTMVHGMLNPWFKRQYPLKHIKKSLFWYPAIRPALQASRAVIFLTGEEPQLANRTFDCTRFQQVVLPLGVKDPRADDVDTGHFFSKAPQTRGKPILLFLGRICRMKACDILLESFAKSSLRFEFKLVMAGPDNENIQSSLIQRARALGIAENVVWTGPLYGDEKLAALKAAELFVLPSHCETFPVAVLEALSMRLPVLISDKVNIWRDVQSSNAGLICYDDVVSTTFQLERWARLSQTEKRAFSERARRCFEASYEVNRAMAAHKEAIKALLN